MFQNHHHAKLKKKIDFRGGGQRSRISPHKENTDEKQNKNKQTNNQSKNKMKQKKKKKKKKKLL